MIFRCCKLGLIVVVGVALIGGVVFGKDLISYVNSSAKSVRTAVKDAVPIEFELLRARDLVEEIIPELQANIHLIAQEEVEIAALTKDIERSGQNLADERRRVAKIRKELEKQQDTYTISGRRFTREQVAQDLARRFDRFRESEVILAGKSRLLETRQNSLLAAMRMLDRTRAQKGQLEQQIETLAGQYRLLQAASVGTPISVDDSKLAQTQKLIGQIKKRLDVAERVLAHDAEYIQSIPIDVVDERDLLEEVDEYFSTDTDDLSPADG